jgi:2-polyprenyl-3-methyl-5-hydroxy-6-metoxy-1,4-benzoquinol methylase
MPTYDADFDTSSDNNSHSLMVRLVGPDKRVLDIGCATGYLGEALAARGCRVSGVEIDPESAARAAKVLDEVMIADLADADLVAHFGPASFDVVVLGDVLEHLMEPDRLLRHVAGLLAPGGSVVISTPNVTHGSLRLALLQGRWRYTDRGLLDRTHIRFFDRPGLLALIEGAGLVATVVRRTTADPLDVEVAIDRDALPPGVIDWVREQPDGLTYQFVVRAVRADAEGSLQLMRHRLDELESELRDATSSADELRAGSERAETELTAARVRAAESERQLLAMRSTVTWRSLRAPRRMYGWLRGGRRR